MTIPSALWPLAGLHVTSKNLELRLPDEDDLVALAELAATGVHAPDVMPFMAPWTDTTPLGRAQNVLRYHWGKWSSWQPHNWTLEFVVLLDGVVVGLQGVSAEHFGLLREVNTGSFLGLQHQGRGTGTHMREAVLGLAFEHLGAVCAHSGVFDDNHASLAVSAKVGYEHNGFDTVVRQGTPAVSHRLRLNVEQWFSRPRPRIEVTGLEPCLPWFGATPDLIT